MHSLDSENRFGYLKKNKKAFSKLFIKAYYTDRKVCIWLSVELNEFFTKWR